MHRFTHQLLTFVVMCDMRCWNLENIPEEVVEDPLAGVSFFMSPSVSSPVDTVCVNSLLSRFLKFMRRVEASVPAGAGGFGCWCCWLL